MISLFLPAARLCMLAATALLLLACAAPAPGTPAAATPDGAGADLACALSTNCVNSLDGSDLSPLRFAGSSAQARAAVLATLASYPEARVVGGGPLHIVAIFTTPAGFRDQVDLRIDAPRGRIDLRSRSLAGVFDFGKNRSRMRDFSARFAKLGKP